MSRALAPAQRRKNDAYYTPDALAKALVKRLPSPGLFGRAIEPSCGAGAFLAAYRKRWPSSWAYGIDVEDHGQKVVADYLTWRPERKPTVVFGNPPYRHAEAFVRHSLDLVHPGGTVAFLLRMGFLASRRRYPMHRSTPPKRITILVERPSFTGGGTDACDYGWFVWEEGYKGPTYVDWLSWKGAA